MVSDQSDRKQFPSRSLWLVHPDLNYVWDHGAHLRTYALAREWTDAGTDVHFVGLLDASTDELRHRAYFEQLVSSGVCSRFSIVRVPVAGRAFRVSKLLFSSSVGMRALRWERTSAMREILSIGSSNDVVVVPDQAWLFAVPELRKKSVTIVEWRDSLFLYNLRQLKASLADGQFARVASLARSTIVSAQLERHIGRAAHANTFVSPVDAKVFGQITGRVGATFVIGNGANATRGPKDVVPDPTRMIFSGNMDFPPNHDAAMWFIRKVMPKVLEQRPDATLYVVGRNPQPELLALAGPNIVVRGFVEDMGVELDRSALFVAPMRTGSGFKNKVVEAMARGLMVVGTSVALEFLPPEVRDLLVIADEPQEIADAVTALLARPPRDGSRTEAFACALETHYSWKAKAIELGKLASELRAS